MTCRAVRAGVVGRERSEGLEGLFQGAGEESEPGQTASAGT